MYVSLHTLYICTCDEQHANVRFQKSPKIIDIVTCTPYKGLRNVFVEVV